MLTWFPFTHFIIFRQMVLQVFPHEETLGCQIEQLLNKVYYTLMRASLRRKEISMST